MNSVIATRLLLCLVASSSACVLRSQDLPPTLAIDAPKLTVPPPPPRATCSGAGMSLESDGATMSAVVAALQTCVSLEVKLPAGLAEERTYFHLGPAPLRDVLDAVLSSTGYNYLVQSSSLRVMTIQLTERTSAPIDPKDPASRLPGSPVSPDLLMTPARRLWLANRSAGRTATDPQGNSEDPASSSPAEPSATLPTVDATPNTTASQPPTDTPNSVVASEPPASSTTAAEAQPSSVLQKEIGQMQQMFEARKKMIVDANTAAHPQPTDPPPNQP